MHHGKYEAKYLQPKRKRRNNKTGTLFLSLLLVVTLAISGTLAYLVTKSDPVENKFTPSHVACQVTENFDGTTKSNVNVKNTGDTEAYIRVKLVTYRVNDAGDHIGGTATIPNFTPGTGWVLNEADGHYYYTLPVAAGGFPNTPLIGVGENGITLISYNDVDGGKQVIEVMAEAIQSQGVDQNGTSAVTLAWGVSVVDGKLSITND